MLKRKIGIIVDLSIKWLIQIPFRNVISALLSQTLPDLSRLVLTKAVLADWDLSVKIIMSTKVLFQLLVSDYLLTQLDYSNDFLFRMALNKICGVEWISVSFSAKSRLASSAVKCYVSSYNFHFFLTLYRLKWKSASTVTQKFYISSRQLTDCISPQTNAVFRAQ